MFFAGPGIRAQEVAAPVSAGSLLPTLLDLAGLEVPPQVEYPSLAATLRQASRPADSPVFSEIDYGLWEYRDGERRVMVRDGRCKLWLYHDPLDPTRFAARKDPVLFDLENDRGETCNLAQDPEYAPTMEALIAQIHAWDRRRTIVRPTTIQRAAP